MSRPLSSRHVELLRWLADGCPERDWPDHAHKIAIRALESRALATVSRKHKIWTAAITERGRYYLEHGSYPPAVAPDPAPVSADLPPVSRGQRRSDHDPVSDTAAGAIERIGHRPALPVWHTECTIPEIHMRYKVVVTRVQVAERLVRATSEQDAASKVRQEIDRTYGYVGSWKTTATEVDVAEVDQTPVIKPTPPTGDGPLLLSLKEAGKALGLARATLYDLVNEGGIDHIPIGSRKYISRQHLTEFIERNTHKGNNRAW